MVTVVWRGLDAPRMEIVRVERGGPGLRAVGTQVGATYELRYLLVGDHLSLDLVGERTLEVDLGGRDFFDLGYSPLFNSLPVWRDGLLEEGPTRTYTMRWISVPDLAVDESAQEYDPLGRGAVRFRAGAFAAAISFDADGYVLRYEGLAERVGR